MSAGHLPFPGTEFGPCALPCEHRDCNETERMSEVICPFCLAPIGYETRYYNLAGKQLVHAVCFEDMIDSLPMNDTQWKDLDKFVQSLGSDHG